MIAENRSLISEAYSTIYRALHGIPPLLVQMSVQGVDAMQLLSRMTEGDMRVEIVNNRDCQRSGYVSSFYNTMAGRRTIRVKGSTSMNQDMLVYRIKVLASHGFVSCAVRAQTFEGCMEDPMCAIETLLLLNEELTGGREHGVDPLGLRITPLLQEGLVNNVLNSRSIRRAHLLQQFLSDLSISENFDVWLSVCAIVRASMACILNRVARSYSSVPLHSVSLASKPCFDVRIGPQMRFDDS